MDLWLVPGLALPWVTQAVDQLWLGLKLVSYCSCVMFYLVIMLKLTS